MVNESLTLSYDLVVGNGQNFLYTIDRSLYTSNFESTFVDCAVTYFTIHDLTGATNLTNTEDSTLIMYNDNSGGSFVKENIYINTQESLPKTTFLIRGYTDAGKYGEMKIYVKITNCTEESIAILSPRAKVPMIVNANSSEIYAKSVEKKFVSTNPVHCPITSYSIAEARYKNSL